MPAAYEARPGTVPFRAIAHLQTLPRGAEVPTATLAMETGAKPAFFTTIMAHAREHGAVFARQKGGHPKSPMFWSLVDHAAIDAAVPPPSKLNATALAPIVAEMPRTGRTRLAPGAVDIDAVHRRHDNVIEMEAPRAGPAGDGSQKPDGAAAIPGARAGSDAHRSEAPSEAAQLGGKAASTDGHAEKRPSEDEGFLVGGFGPALPKVAPAVRTITLTVEVANLHQAERVLQLVREMAGEGA